MQTVVTIFSLAIATIDPVVSSGSFPKIKKTIIALGKFLFGQHQLAHVLSVFPYVS